MQIIFFKKIRNYSLSILLAPAPLFLAGSAQATSNSITASDTAGAVGGYTWLALDGHGNPAVMSYCYTKAPGGCVS